MENPPYDIVRRIFCFTFVVGYFLSVVSYLAT